MTRSFRSTGAGGIPYLRGMLLASRGKFIMRSFFHRAGQFLTGRALARLIAARVKTANNEESYHAVGKA
jgi:hypothetical protein